MIEIKMSPNAPKIAQKIKDNIESLKNVENYVLSLQLDYRDNNTIFYFKNVCKLNFEKEWLEIVQSNNSHAFFDYNYILEYNFDLGKKFLPILHPLENQYKSLLPFLPRY